MKSSFSLKMPNASTGHLNVNNQNDKEKHSNALFFPISSWNFISKIQSFLSDEQSVVEQVGEQAPSNSQVKTYGYKTLREAMIIISQEQPQSWNFQIRLDGNPDTRPIYALAKMYSTIILGASINEKGQWCLNIAGDSYIHDNEFKRTTTCDISDEAGELGSVPEYYKTAIHEVAILLVQQYTNYHWIN